MDMNKLIPILAALLVAAAGCTHRRSHGEPVDILRLDRAVADVASGKPLDSSMAPGADAWLYVTRGISPGSLDVSVRDSLLRVEAGGRAFAIFGPDVDSLLPPLGDAMAWLGRLTGFPRTVYGMVSPYNQSVVTVDSTVIIALNHYLGEDYAGYRNFPEYRRRLKSVERIAPDVAEAWLRHSYPFADSIIAPQLYQRIAYEGALLATVADELGIDDGAFLMGWTDDEWTNAIGHEAEGWNRLVGLDMLFSDDQGLASRLISPSPSTNDISPDAPGRLGRFIGLRMIRAAIRSGDYSSPREILESRAYLDNGIFGPYARSVR